MKARNRVICAAREVPEGGSRKFLLEKGGDRAEGFLVRHRGRFHAYVNRCRHVALPLDWDDGDFLSADKRYLVCKNHGALYLPGSGLCIGGPCAGQALEKLSLKLSGGKIVYAGTDWELRKGTTRKP